MDGTPGKSDERPRSQPPALNRFAGSGCRGRMKIVAHTPTELIIRDSAVTLRAFGIFLLAFAAFVVAIGVAQDPGGRVDVFPMVIGTVLALGGLALVVLPWRKTFAFSKSERVFVIVRQRFGRVE